MSKLTKRKYIKRRKNTKYGRLVFRAVRGLNKEIPQDYGCPECNQAGFHTSIVVKAGNVVCTNCGLLLSFSEYYDYIESFKLKQKGVD